MHRFSRVLIGALLLASCSNETSAPSDPAAMDAGAPCIDRDRDGFGLNCPLGNDCDDRTAASTNECRSCQFPDTGCACDANAQPTACFLQDMPLDDGNVMCREGTRFCRNGLWGQCEDVHSYVVVPDPTATALIDPNAPP